MMLIVNRHLRFPKSTNPLLNCTSGRIHPVLPSRMDAPKVIFVLGATGTGKSKLAIDLAGHFNGEIVNSDKMQVYDGLSVITNKVTEKEMAGIPHHLIGGVHPDADFTVEEFCRAASDAVETILRRGKVPIIAGGSNTYIEALVNGSGGDFAAKYDCCFLWVDVELPVLHEFVRERVDKMVQKGFLEEARKLFKLDAYYTKGVRRSLGVPEMDSYFRSEVVGNADEITKKKLLEEAIEKTKVNTCKLTRTQLEKIHRLRRLPGWDIRRVDLTEVFISRGSPEEEEMWFEVAVKPSVSIVEEFLIGKMEENSAAMAGKVRDSNAVILAPSRAIAAADAVEAAA